MLNLRLGVVIFGFFVRRLTKETARRRVTNRGRTNDGGPGEWTPRPRTGDFLDCEPLRNCYLVAFLT